ncbi:MAG: hypothetical protein DDG60_08100 [Anaerolineae bacterium]|nr:MAG: hypothetical protein DDG60_08100 [Anaerolineae bacterium]
MNQPLYFQWQNEFLLKTIYPLREVKLCDFLIYFAEIDIWQAYKDKTPAELGADIRAYHQTQAALVQQALQEYQIAKDYFLKPDVRADYVALLGDVDETELNKIHQLHAQFIQFLPSMRDVRKEKYFIGQFEPQWVERRAEIRRLIASKKRRIEELGADHPRRSQELTELDRMYSLSLRMVDEELIRLRKLIKALERIYDRKLQLFEAQENARRRKDQLIRKLPTYETNLRPLEAKYETLSAELERLKSPPDYRLAEQHFQETDPAALLGEHAEPRFLKRVVELRKAMLGEYSYAGNKPLALRNHLFNWQQFLKELEKEAATLEVNLRNAAPGWSRRAESEARLNALRQHLLVFLRSEIAQLTNFQAGLSAISRPQAEIEKEIKAKEQELQKVHQNLSVLCAERDALQKELAESEAILAIDETAWLSEYQPSGAITAKQIARAKVEEYRMSLEHKNSQELLEMVVERFLAEPERFPLWLQYMVIHFSGMRYRSAHGSWASPRDLLIRLHSAKMEKELQALSDEDIQKRCQARIEMYTTAHPNRPGLADAPEKTWKDKLALHLQGIKANGPKTRRAALLALTIDERRYELEQMSEEQALEEIERMKDTFPAWAWKEIVAVTPLRVNHVQDLNWEKLTPAEEAQKNAREYGELRAILGKWREENMGAWREEHARTHRLIVSRAVCNETAEHCQHLRGHHPPGGLTAKAPWYLKHERENKLPGQPRPYFVKPKKREDFTVGASILWLRFVSEEFSPWRVARPIATKDGDTLLDPQVIGKSDWKYTTTDMVKRTRTFLDAEKKQVTQEQWLRWIHEATVAAVGDTAEGPVVLTFETALPDDDPGLSSIGLFRIWLSNALYMGTEENYNGSFVGFVPEGDVPYAHLREMLDWNKILRREVMSPEAWQAYQEKYLPIR